MPCLLNAVDETISCWGWQGKEIWVDTPCTLADARMVFPNRQWPLLSRRIGNFLVLGQSCGWNTKRDRFAFDLYDCKRFEWEKGIRNTSLAYCIAYFTCSVRSQARFRLVTATSAIDVLFWLANRIAIPTREVVCPDHIMQRPHALRNHMCGKSVIQQWNAFLWFTCELKPLQIIDSKQCRIDWKKKHRTLLCCSSVGGSGGVLVSSSTIHSRFSITNSKMYSKVLQKQYTIESETVNPFCCPRPHFVQHIISVLRHCDANNS